MKLIHGYLIYAMVAILTLPAFSQAQDSTAEKDFKGRTARETILYLSGIKTSEQNHSLITSLSATKGINSINATDAAPGMVFLKINTVLIPDELVNCLKKWNPKAYFEVTISTDLMMQVIVSDKPVVQRKKTNTAPAITEPTNTLDQGIVAAPQEGARTSVVVDPEEDNNDKVFTKVMFPAEFPGGDSAWHSYLERNLNTDIPKLNGAPAGTYQVVVQFLVKRDGTASEFSAETKPGYGMEKETIRVISKVSKWLPGSNDDGGYMRGNSVNSYKQLPVTFVVKR